MERWRRVCRSARGYRFDLHQPTWHGSSQPRRGDPDLGRACDVLPLGGLNHLTDATVEQASFHSPAAVEPPALGFRPAAYRCGGVNHWYLDRAVARPGRRAARRAAVPLGLKAWFVGTACAKCANAAGGGRLRPAPTSCRCSTGSRTTRYNRTLWGRMDRRLVRPPAGLPVLFRGRHRLFARLSISRRALRSRPRGDSDRRLRAGSWSCM